MRIYVGCDHAGYEMRKDICDYLRENNYEVIECLMHDYNELDYYTDAAYEVCEKVENDSDSKGILICGTGIGMSIAANRNKNIRAGHCTCVEEAQLTRFHNDANVLCLGARIIDLDKAKKIVDTFLNTPFSAEEKHQRRIDKIED